MSARQDGFVDYEDLTPSQQKDVWDWLSGTKIWRGRFEAMPEVAVKIKKDGRISRRHSDRTLSTAAAKKLDAILRGKPTRRANDDVASGGVH